MTLQVIRNWVSKLPPYELDMPIVMYNGVAYTPRQILEEVERGTQLGAVLQQMVESGTPVLGQNPALSQSELEELAKMRIKATVIPLHSVIHRPLEHGDWRH